MFNFLVFIKSFLTFNSQNSLVSVCTKKKEKKYCSIKISYFPIFIPKDSTKSLIIRGKVFGKTIQDAKSCVWAYQFYGALLPVEKSPLSRRDSSVFKRSAKFLQSAFRWKIRPGFWKLPVRAREPEDGTESIFLNIKFFSNQIWVAFFERWDVTYTLFLFLIYLLSLFYLYYCNFFTIAIFTLNKNYIFVIWLQLILKILKKLNYMYYKHLKIRLLYIF